MSKQSALQQFVDKITNNHDKHFKEFYKAEIEEALQMEREQIIDAYERGRQDFYSNNNRIYGEQYYKETYGGKDE
jgi:hypothetical protein